MLKRLGDTLSWAVLRRKLVGKDAHGNSYYIRMEKNLDGELVEKRFVKFQGGEYLPEKMMSPEWMQWLQTTRRDAPSDKEIDNGTEDTTGDDKALGEWLRRQEQKSSGQNPRKTPVIPIQR